MKGCSMCHGRTFCWPVSWLQSGVCPLILVKELQSLANCGRSSLLSANNECSFVGYCNSPVGLRNNKRSWASTSPSIQRVLYLAYKLSALTRLASFKLCSVYFVTGRLWPGNLVLMKMESLPPPRKRRLARRSSTLVAFTVYVLIRYSEHTGPLDFRLTEACRHPFMVFRHNIFLLPPLKHWFLSFLSCCILNVRETCNKANYRNTQ